MPTLQTGLSEQGGLQRGCSAVGPVLDPGSGFLSHHLPSIPRTTSGPRKQAVNVTEAHVRGSLKGEKWKSQCLLMECAGWGWGGRLEGSLRRDGELFGNLSPVRGGGAGGDSRTWVSTRARGAGGDCRTWASTRARQKGEAGGFLRLTKKAERTQGKSGPTHETPSAAHKRHSTGREDSPAGQGALVSCHLLG